eukprot:g6399.t1
MGDTQERSDIIEPLGDTMAYELCIVGAGYAGVNAFNAATKYLAPGARVLVVDQHAEWGGMWNHAYGFVRLHQPHRMYTAGERRWSLRKPEGHLATLTEIRAHFFDIVDACVAESRVQLRTMFGYSFKSHEADRARGTVQIQVEPVDADAHSRAAAPVTLEARRLIIATGFDIAPKRPLRFSCGPARVHSLTPGDLREPRWHSAMRDGPGAGKPIWIIGSGKTAVDTINYLSKDAATAGRLHCVSGRGTWFFNRARMFPTASTREGWWQIHTPGWRVEAIDAMLDMFELWDGTNGAEVYRALGAKGALITPIDGASCFVAGNVDPHEVQTMRSALSPATERIVRAYLLDVEDGDSGPGGTAPLMRLRLVPTGDGSSGGAGPAKAQGEVVLRELEPGSYIVNCTDHLREIPHRPVVDDSGLVLAPQNIGGFSGPTAHVVTHGWFLGTLTDRLWRALPRTVLKNEAKHPGDKINAGIRLVASVFFNFNALQAKCLPPDLRRAHQVPFFYGAIQYAGETSYIGAGLKAAPLRGNVACVDAGPLATRPTATVGSRGDYDATNIYGPIEDGFSSSVPGMSCLGSTSVQSGIDTNVAEAIVLKICGTAVEVLDSCGGHAVPYHYHERLQCLYSADAATNHSTRVGTALDGNGIYGKYITGGVLPTDLDACGGRVGVTPDSGGVEVYYYPITDTAPFTLGCFADKASYPVSVTQCKTLYSECSSAPVTLTTNHGSGQYIPDCPCFDAYHSNVADQGLPGFLDPNTATPGVTAAATTVAATTTTGAATTTTGAATTTTGAATTTTGAATTTTGAATTTTGAAT